MTILNIHGYQGNPKNSAYSALTEIGYREIIAPAVDYDNENPCDVINSLNKIRVENNTDLIVGTSLGGFYAAVLSAMNDVPVILINPCLTPFLIEFLPQAEIKALISLFGNLSKLNLSNVSCIVGDADEVLGDHYFTEQLLCNQRFRRIAGGMHSGFTLPLKEYFEEIMHDYTSFY